MLDGVLSKRLGAGFAARGAVPAAFLATDGITGPFQPLEGNAGLFKLQERGEVRPDELMEGMGKEWRTRGYSFKPYPCCRCNHTSISLAIRLREQGLRPENVEAVEIRLPQVNYQTVGQPYDVTRDSIVHAQFNAAYSFARALTDGHVDLRTYTRPNITDPDVAALAARIVVKPDPNEPPTAMGPSHIAVKLKDGSATEIHETMTPGSPELPMTEEEVFAKFRLCMDFGLGLSAEQVEPVIQTILRLEELGDIRELVALMPSADL
jgi:2-methylcitrate dehydratase PrpD